MEITIKINGRMTVVEVSAEIAECMDTGRRKAENLSHERRRHWDCREFDEYIVAAEGLLPCQYTPEDLACQQETLDEIFSVLDTCTPTQRERFLLFAMDGYTVPQEVLPPLAAAGSPMWLQQPTTLTPQAGRRITVLSKVTRTAALG